MLSNCFGTVCGTVEIGGNNLVPLLFGAVQNTAVGWATCVGDEDVNLAKLLDDVLDELDDIIVVPNVALERLGLDSIPLL